MMDVFREFVAEVVGGHLAMRHSENGKFARQKFGLRQVVERRNKFAAGQVSGSAEDHHNARVGGTAWGALLGSGKHFRLGHR